MLGDGSMMDGLEGICREICIPLSQSKRRIKICLRRWVFLLSFAHLPLILFRLHFTPFRIAHLSTRRKRPTNVQLFINHPTSRLRHEQNLPIQVFAGWNGIAVMNPRPFFPPYNVRFRRGAPKSLLSMEWECQASESSFISWDFWKVSQSRTARPFRLVMMRIWLTTSSALDVS